MNNRTLTILAIDDDEEIRFALKAVFDFQGWQALTASHVKEGIALFREHRPDIVLIDYHMPEINGIEGVRMLRQIGGDVPIIVFTIDEDQQVADRFLEAGASDFALKPIKAPDIISRIKLHVRLMESRKAAEPVAKGIGGATLDLIRDCLTRAGETYLTANEIAVATGLAYQTTYRYLQHLVAEGVLESKSSYGKIGRPKQSFRWIEK
ncbi:response regulator [Pygmaiobacter massiliensis]|uniref:response regulator n=1 Tax=Pygmaiobacter massiliensis TaxID=1917873 RepID=UPI000C7A6081|nr:response regulator [Pygmaiobacter massiliensis]